MKNIKVDRFIIAMFFIVMCLFQFFFIYCIMSNYNELIISKQLDKFKSTLIIFCIFQIVTNLFLFISIFYAKNYLLNEILKINEIQKDIKDIKDKLI